MKNFFFLGVALLCFASGPLQADVPAAIAKVKPSVVIVGAFKPTDSPRFALRATGFVVGQGQADTSNLVITNAHVLDQPADLDPDSALVVQIRVRQGEWQMRRASVVDVDLAHDLALLRFEGPPVQALTVGDSDQVSEGQSIAFMGFPLGGALGFSPVTHRGMVSSITVAALPAATARQLNDKNIRSLRAHSNFNIFQLDGTAYPGNSGGPLFDPVTGHVLGVVNMVFIKGNRESALTHPSGISYAIPSGFVRQLLERNQKP